MIKEYKNNTVLEIKDVRPINDDVAIERGNSLRLLDVSTNINKYFECKNACNNNKNCSYFDFDLENTTCKLYRKEPFKKIENVNKDLCLEMCHRDKKCDYLHHNKNNECFLFSREDIKEAVKSNINELWFDFAVYGINKDKSTKTNDFEECLKKNNNNNCIYYEKTKMCIPKLYYVKSTGDTTIYINRTPLNKYSSRLNKLIGLKSKDRNYIIKYKIFFLIFVLLIFGFILYYYAGNFRKKK